MECQLQLSTWEFQKEQYIFHIAANRFLRGMVRLIVGMCLNVGLGKLKLEEELSLISNLDLMLSMDSGNGHLAAMLGVNVITIWGVTHPFAGFAPFNQPEDYALVADREQYPLIPTSVYGNTYPEGYENAAGSISVEEIVAKIKSVISAKAAI